MRYRHVKLNQHKPIQRSVPQCSDSPRFPGVQVDSMFADLSVLFQAAEDPEQRDDSGTQTPQDPQENLAPPQFSSHKRSPSLPPLKDVVPLDSNPTDPSRRGVDEYEDIEATIRTYLIQNPVTATASGAPDAHADTHIQAGSDEIDGDQLDVDWDPSNYTPDTTPAQASSVDHLTAHLYGIDQALAAAGGGTPATTVTDETSFGAAPAVGTDTEYARQDHTHGTPTNPVTAHAADADAHHAEAHTIASHSDTTATGAELETLTDGSDAADIHIHDARYFTETEHLDVSAGAGDAGKPIKLDAGGHVDASMINDADITIPVTSVFGRTGDVAAATSDYDASEVDNDSIVAGATVKDALDDYGAHSAAPNPHGTTLDDLPGVSVSSPANGQVLTYDSVGGNWENDANPGRLVRVAIQVPGPRTGEALPILHVPDAMSLTSVRHITDTGTVDFNLEHRAEATPDATSATEVWSSDKTANSTSSNETSFTDGTIAAGIVLTIVFDSPSSVGTFWLQLEGVLT